MFLLPWADIGSATWEPIQQHHSRQLSRHARHGRCDQSGICARGTVALGPRNVVLPRVGRLAVEVYAVGAQDAVSNDVVVVCISQHGFGM